MHFMVRVCIISIVVKYKYVPILKRIYCFQLKKKVKKNSQETRITTCCLLFFFYKTRNQTTNFNWVLRAETSFHTDTENIIRYRIRNVFFFFFTVVRLKTKNLIWKRFRSFQYWTTRDIQRLNTIYIYCYCF